MLPARPQVAQAVRGTERNDRGDRVGVNVDMPMGKCCWSSRTLQAECIMLHVAAAATATCFLTRSQTEYL